MDGSQDLRSRPDAGQIADLLEGLDDLPFGGKPKGRFRISRKFLRMFAGRRRLPSELVSAIADEMFERGYVMIEMETYFVVIPQRYFGSYRRVTAAVVAKALPVGPLEMDGDAETDAEQDD